MKRLFVHLKAAFAATNGLQLNAFGAFAFGVVIALGIAWESRNVLPVEAILSILILIPLIFTVAGVALARRRKVIPCCFLLVSLGAA